MRWQSLNLEELVGNLPLNGATLVVQAPQAIDADPDLLSAALLNLLDNAVRHHASRIEIVAHVRDGLTRLEVRDNGEGMSPARLTEVEAALRGEATPAGIGLGLTMTQLVARPMAARSPLASDQIANQGGGDADLGDRGGLATEQPGNEQPGRRWARPTTTGPVIAPRLRSPLSSQMELVSPVMVHQGVNHTF